MRPTGTDVLLVVDVQRDFLPGGALAVPDGDAVVAPANRLGRLFSHVVLTQDWHPPGHASFATSHPDRQVFDSVALPYGPQVLWPEHCVQGTPGADFAPGLDLPQAELVIRKGCRPGIDSYSAFLEADRTTPTGLAGYLRERGVTRVVLCGLATDYCVGWSALDARRAGFSVAVVEDAVRGIDLGGSLARAWGEMAAAGVERVTTDAVRGA
ncbi:bifunctional nicotinamidase/pyrazinamidase [uncultured Methylobacterium sp.]|jgi:nicotinamidase/pyrazinamidase|uniref:bifunctional nicotinamidase/pyrazinamidase n=1 Tax=uncultured Methylobacterium sp. TaxID=157278 RepID=UPI002635EF40|nr:bifunctional nicotinamidase/pyrazinamidase [uncultured Methylobacterium sp.]